MTHLGFWWRFLRPSKRQKRVSDDVAGKFAAMRLRRHGVVAYSRVGVLLHFKELFT